MLLYIELCLYSPELGGDDGSGRGLAGSKRARELWGLCLQATTTTTIDNHGKGEGLFRIQLYRGIVSEYVEPVLVFQLELNKV